MKIGRALVEPRQMVVPASFVETVSLVELMQLVVQFPKMKHYLGVLLRKVHPIGPACTHQLVRFNIHCNLNSQLSKSRVIIIVQIHMSYTSRNCCIKFDCHLQRKCVFINYSYGI